jgi:hypothetical protein
MVMSAPSAVAWESRQEDVEHSDAVAEASVAPVNERPPEEQSAEEETDVHRGVNALVADGRLVERRSVPDPQRGAVEEARP